MKLNLETDEIAVWRFGVIATLLHSDPFGRTQKERLEELSGRSFDRQGSPPVQISGETLRRWLYRYQKGGLPGLSDRFRTRPCLIPDDLQKNMFDDTTIALVTWFSEQEILEKSRAIGRGRQINQVNYPLFSSAPQGYRRRDLRRKPTQ